MKNEFKKNQLLQTNDKIVRVLDIKDNQILIIDCVKETMPTWSNVELLYDYSVCSETQLFERTGTPLSKEQFTNNKIVHERYTLIAPILPFVSDIKKRSELIENISKTKAVSKQTIRHYLCKYLVYQDIMALAPKQVIKDYTLSKDEKNIRWALNKFFYTNRKNSLREAYTFMLKERYCDELGNILSSYPSFYQFRYFYRKTRKMQTYYISRNGLKDYQKNHRPLLGDGVQQYASSIGTGMLDSTTCDIYLVNEAGNLVGRPILTACIDAYSSLCCGYSLSWEGGIYSLKGLMLNIISDKQEWCKQHGIIIEKSQWNVDKLPGTFVTDMGFEYKSENFEQITELGVTVTNLPAYRPELKGPVEKFFDIIQSTYKTHLKGKGVVEPNFQERGIHDYRKDACLTLEDFEKVILRCIIYYNSQRIIKNFPYTEEMIQNKIRPCANNIWEFGKTLPGANLITASKEQIIMTLLPRTIGKFSRTGLKANKMRYGNNEFTEKYLTGGEEIVAYNPDDVSCVWLVGKDNSYTRFELVEGRYRGKKLSDIELMQKDKNELVKTAIKDNLQAQIDLASSIEIIALSANKMKVNMKTVRKTRKKEQAKTHIDYIREEIKHD